MRHNEHDGGSPYNLHNFHGNRNDWLSSVSDVLSAKRKLYWQGSASQIVYRTLAKS